MQRRGKRLGEGAADWMAGAGYRGTTWLGLHSGGEGMCGALAECWCLS